MGKIVLVTGGARSGKSSFAESLVNQEDKVLYIATAIPFDEEMKHRIEKHQERRPSGWSTLEKYCEFEHLAKSEEWEKADIVLLDCLGVMLNNLFFDESLDFEKCSIAEMECIEKRMSDEVGCILEQVNQSDKKIIFVTNEVGLSIVPQNRLSRYYRDFLGRANCKVAQWADEVYLLVCGIPLKIK